MLTLIAKGLRSFQKNGNVVNQLPPVLEARRYTIKCGGLEGEFAIFVYLYGHAANRGVKDEKKDQFAGSLLLCPISHHGPLKDELRITRGISGDGKELRHWLLNLEGVITSAIFVYDHDYDRIIMRLLLECVDKVKEVEEEIAGDQLIRSNLLHGSDSQYAVSHSVSSGMTSLL